MGGRAPCRIHGVMARFKILVLDGLHPAGLDLLRREPRFDVAERRALSPADLPAAVADADALLVRSATKVTDAVMAAAPRLKVIGRPGAGVDNIDTEAAARRGIVVLSTPGANAEATAEHTIALLFALARHVPQAFASLQAGRWERAQWTGVQLAGKTLGLLGCGRVGRAVAGRARGLKMSVLAHDPAADPRHLEACGALAVPFDALLAGSDVLSVHVPLTPETRGLLGREALSRMRPGALLLNCARGGIVDEAALAEALRAGRLAGAALDVFAQEPPPAGHPLLALPNVVATPHLGAATAEAQEEAARDLAGQLSRFLLPGPPPTLL